MSVAVPAVHRARRVPHAAGISRNHRPGSWGGAGTGLTSNTHWPQPSACGLPLPGAAPRRSSAPASGALALRRRASGAFSRPCRPLTSPAAAGHPRPLGSGRAAAGPPSWPHPASTAQRTSGTGAICSICRLPTLIPVATARSLVPARRRPSRPHISAGRCNRQQYPLVGRFSTWSRNSVPAPFTPVRYAFRRTLTTPSVVTRARHDHAPHASVGPRPRRSPPAPGGQQQPARPGRAAPPRAATPGPAAKQQLDLRQRHRRPRNGQLGEPPATAPAPPAPHPPKPPAHPALATSSTRGFPSHGPDLHFRTIRELKPRYSRPCRVDGLSPPADAADRSLLCPSGWLC